MLCAIGVSSCQVPVLGCVGRFDSGIGAIAWIPARRSFRSFAVKASVRAPRFIQGWRFGVW